MRARGGIRTRTYVRIGRFKFGRFVLGCGVAWWAVPMSCPDCYPIVRRVVGCRAVPGQSRDTVVTRRLVQSPSGRPESHDR